MTYKLLTVYVSYLLSVVGEQSDSVSPDQDIAKVCRTLYLVLLRNIYLAQNTPGVKSNSQEIKFIFKSV